MEFKENDLLLSRYRLIRQIGKGGFSVVWQSLDEITNVELAIKIYAPDKGLDEKGVKQFTKEYRLTQPLNHPNLLKPTHYDVVPDLNAPFLVMPFCHNGSLGAYLDDHEVLDEASIAKLMVEIGGALGYLHHQNPPILHQDIKPDNVLIANDGQYMLTDFGISNKMRSTLRKSTVGQSALTVAYAPPEKYSNQGISEASDVFSLGIMLFECLTDEVPWGGDGGVMLLKGAHLPDLPSDFPDRLNKVVHACLSVEVTQRPSAEQIKQIGEFFQANGFWPKPEEFIASLATADAPASKPKSRARKTQVLEKADMEISPAYVGAKTIADGGAGTLSAGVSKKHNRGWLYGVAAVVVVGLAIAGYFLFQGNTSKADNPNPLALNDSTNASNETIANDSVYNNMMISTSQGDSTQLASNESSEQHEVPKQEKDKKQKETVSEKPNPPSSASLDQRFKQAKDLFNDKEYREAFGQFAKLSSQGHAEATWYLGYQKREGLGTTKDLSQAISYYTRAGDLGDPAGYNSVGYMYDNAMGVREDDAKAFNFYLKAANMGYKISQFNVGLYYDEGLGGQSRNWNKAFQWYKKAAAQSHDLAQRMVGEFYLFGVGGASQSKTSASRYFQLAANNGDNKSATYLEVIKELDGNESVYKRSNLTGDEIWVRPDPEVLKPSTLYGLGAKWSYRVFYKLDQSSTIEIFPMFEDDRKERKITDDVKYADYSGCEKLTSESGVHDFYITNRTKPRREIGYVYITGYVQNVDLVLKIPAAVCWPAK